MVAKKLVIPKVLDAQIRSLHLNQLLKYITPVVSSLNDNSGINCICRLGAVLGDYWNPMTTSKKCVALSNRNQDKFSICFITVNKTWIDHTTPKTLSNSRSSGVLRMNRRLRWVCQSTQLSGCGITPHRIPSKQKNIMPTSWIGSSTISRTYYHLWPWIKCIPTKIIKVAHVRSPYDQI